MIAMAGAGAAALPADQLLETTFLPSILAIIVLYKVPAEQSQSYVSMRALLDAGMPAAAAYELMVFDNTPGGQAGPRDFDGVYQRDESNAGLAAAYNAALKVAAAKGTPWVLLLDQDTTLTAEFLEEAAAAAEELAPRREVAALIPKLWDRGVICSPHFPPLLHAARPLPAESYGIAPADAYMFNSGAVVRVSAMQGIGGFPVAYPLDFLDHATFAALKRAGGQLFILRSILKHELSDVNRALPDPALVPRQLGVLDAEYRFYRVYGTFSQRMMRRLRLLRSAAGRAAKGKDWGQTQRILRSALRF